THFGGNLAGPFFGGTFSDCLTACAENSSCVDVTYTSGGTCYLKSSVGDAYAEAGSCDGLLPVPAPSSSTSSSTSSPSPSAPPTCGGYANGTTTVISGQTFTI
ncbi:uncharacterized protein BDZ99DRAFT_458604, partial [Mytilinidion resinicola]